MRKHATSHLSLFTRAMLRSIVTAVSLAGVQAIALAGPDDLCGSMEPAVLTDWHLMAEGPDAMPAAGEWSGENTAAAALACRPYVNVSLGQAGFALITPEMLVLAPQYPLNMYTVDIMGPLTNTVTCAQLGQELMVMVNELPTGNACMSTIKIEDKLKPTFNCTPDVVPCTVDIFELDFADYLEPVNDNCDSDPDLWSSYTIQNLPCNPNNYTQQVTVTWTATDQSGNSATCTDILYLVRPSINQIVFPPNTSVPCTNPNTDPSVTGEPTYQGEPISHTCQYVVGKSDTTIPMCNGSYKIQRLWQVMDWCTGATRTHVQEILVVDNTPPTLTCPPSVTVGTDPGVCTRKYTFPAPTVSDACASQNLIDIKITTNTVPGIYTPGQMVTLGLGVSTITIRATDPCGNSSTCIYLVTVRDQTPPVIFCPANVTIQCSGDTSPAATGNATATDFCDQTPTVTYTDATMSLPGCANAYKITRTWRATDDAGNSAMCMQMITLADTQPPVVTCPPNTTIACGSSTLPQNTGGSATATDNCDNAPAITHTDATVAGECPQEYTLNRTWIATDDCGNSGTCLQVIQVIDVQAPAITCPPDMTIMCDESSDPSNTGFATATDNCDPGPDITYDDITMASGPQSYTIERTWTAEDACGNFNTCFQLITVVDMTPPVFTFCPDDITIQCTQQPLPPLTGQPAASDNCDPSVAIDYSDATVAGACPQEYTITRTWIATDDCGNTTTCEQVITIDDSMAPTITCPANVTIACTASTNPSVNTALGMASATDNCDGSPAITFTDATVGGACPQEYTITRTWRAQDDCGNFSTCNQIIVVDDSAAPAITCPANITIQCTASTNPSVNMALGMATATDNCDGTPAITFTDVTVGGACPQAYTITRTWRAQDDCGNFSTCNQLITVQDNLPPSVTCPANVTIDCSASTLPPATGSATAVDACDPSVTPTYADVTTGGSCAQEYIITRTWTAQDDCGNGTNCIQVITVTDMTAPVITCPANITIQCTASTMPSNTGSATALDACDPSVVPTFSDVTIAGGCPQERTINRTWTATDDCGNTSTCLQVIVVDDSVAPSIACPSNITISCAASTAPANTGSATATDNCDGTPTISFTDVVVGGACPEEETITRTWVATDDCGNSTSCVQIITVDDNVAPTITCPANITILCTASTSPGNTGSATAIDVCDDSPDVTFTDATVAGSCAQEYTINRTWVATDNCGNSSTCLQVISVDDNQAPQITCPPNVTITCTQGDDPAVTGSATATDNCTGTPEITYADVSVFGQCPELVTITRTWTASDGCGNTATCIQIIIETDNQSPVITCPADVTIECTASTDPNNTGVATATDDCTPEPDIDYTDVTAGTGCPEGYSITRTWIATDFCGNTATCIQNILVDDNIAPVVTCPADVTLDCTEDTSTENTGNATATDNCAPSPVITFADVTTGTGCPDGYVITRTWTAEDDCGNTGTCVQVITVDDNSAPLVTCPANMTIECSESTTPANTGNATATDVCDPTPTVTFTDATVAGACPQTYTINRTWTATDNCGNAATCLQTIVLEDTTNPICQSQDITISLDGSGNATITAAQVNDGSSDACGPVTLAVSPSAFNCEDLGANVVTLTVTDCAGNVSSCTAIVFVEEGAGGLQANCQNVTITLDANGMATVDPSQVNNGSGGGCNPGDLEFDLSQTNFDCTDLGPNIVVLTVTDEQGNTATCTAIITVIDNMPPSITCPPNVTVDCHIVTDPENTGQFGNATATDNCPPAVITETHVINLNNCNEGTITRTFVATDASGNSISCVQVVTVNNPDPFDASDITWPASPVNVNICNSTLPQNIPNGQPTFDQNALLCADISVSYSDDVDVFVDNNPATPCQVIMRTWTVTNNCTPVTMFTFVQTINVTDSQPPVFTNINDMTKTANVNTCTAAFTLIANATDCAGVTITNNSPYGANNGANASGNYPIGQTTVIFTATDGCGNTATMDVVITVLDPDPTEFECEKIIIFMPPETEVTLHADTFVVYFEGACTTAEDFIVSYSSTNPYDTVRTYDCGDVGVTTFPLYFWMVGTPPMIVDTCPFADLDLRDPNDFCMDGLVVSGEVGNESGLPLEGVEVTVANAPMDPDMTDEGGSYWIDGFVEGGDYEIRPLRDINHREGVSTLDLVMIQKHLLGKARLNSPYKLIAADANKSGHITALDLIEIRKLILGISNRFPNNTSWRFVDETFAFPDPFNPFATAFPESVRLDSIAGMIDTVNFIAMKVGDVNGSFFLNKAQGGQLEARTVFEYGLEVNELPETGSEARVFELRVADGQPAIDGMQFTLDIGKLTGEEARAISSDVLTADQYYYDSATGQLRVSFAAQTPVAPEGKALLRWTTADRGQDNIRIHVGDIVPEAYIAAAEEPEVWRLRLADVHYLPETGTTGYELFQNVPNPFTEETLIRFNLPADERVRVAVFDQTGRQLHAIDLEGIEGLNEVRLPAGVLGAPGVYYYTLYTAQASFTRKMTFATR